MEEPVESIRESARFVLTVNRRTHRNEETDGRRDIDSKDVTQEVIADIANKLKAKSTSTTELHTLKNGLLDNPHYIEVVLNTQGAVRALVRELTGHEANRQTAAAGCLCNLALGDARACTTLVKSAGPYLVTALDSLNTELAITCVWALGNAAGSGAKAIVLMTSQGAISKLAALMKSPADDTREAAAIALLQFAYQMEDDFSQEHISQVLSALPLKKLTKSSLHLLFVLSCHDDFSEMIDEELLQNILEFSTESMEIVNDSFYEFVYVIRTLANIELNDKRYSAILDHFSLKVNDVKNIFMMNIDTVNRSLHWFLGNLFNYGSSNEFFNRLLT